MQKSGYIDIRIHDCSCNIGCFVILDEDCMDDEEDDEEDYAPSSHRLASKLGVSSHHVQVMKASFFGDEDMDTGQSTLLLSWSPIAGIRQHLSVRPFIHTFIHPSKYSIIYPSIHPSKYSSIHPSSHFIQLSVHPSIHFIQLSVRPSIQ